MAIKWLCTGKSEHGYQYKDTEGTIQNAKVIAIDFKAEIDTENASGNVNELFDTKPVLTEAGVTGFVGLQVYPQGFTVYADTRLTNQSVEDAINIGSKIVSVMNLLTTNVGGILQLNDADDGGDDGGIS